MSQDEYYANTFARIDTIIGHQGIIWQKIAGAKKDFDQLNSYNKDFSVWIKDTYGINLQFDQDGMISLNSSIIDEQKYLIFLLKYSNKNER